LSHPKRAFPTRLSRLLNYKLDLATQDSADCFLTTLRFDIPCLSSASQHRHERYLSLPMSVYGLYLAKVVIPYRIVLSLYHYAASSEHPSATATFSPFCFRDLRRPIFGRARCSSTNTKTHWGFLKSSLRDRADNRII
jgi:hypothetical protein